MASLNINGLITHLDELKVLLHNSNIDIFAVNETKLESSILNGEVSIPGYEIVRKDRVKNGLNGGGVCIYIRSNHNYSIRQDLMADDLEFICIELKRLRSKPFLISTWYRPPNSTLEKMHTFENILECVDATGLDYYLLGDINCDLLHLTTMSQISTRLCNIFDTFGLHQLIKEPTRITSTTKTLIDLCVTNAIDCTTNSGVLHIGISDHSLVYMSRKQRVIKSLPKICKVRSFKHFNEAHFKNDVSQMPWSNVDVLDDPNEMWSMWSKMLMQAIDKHAPIKNRRVGSKRREPWITNSLVEQMRRRDLLKRQANNSNDHEIWKNYKKERNLTNKAVKHAKREYFVQNIDKSNPRKTWKIINKIRGKTTEKSSIKGIKANDLSISDPKEMSEVFNEHFTSIGNKLAEKIIPPNKSYKEFLKPAATSFSISPPDSETVCKLLRGLDVSKAVGLDNIPNRLLKIASDIVGPSLCMIFRKSVESGIFPEEWKLAKVTPVFKKGERTDVNNYRPISVVPTIAKIFEKIIHDQLYSYLNVNELLAPCQSGFRSMHSTTTALLEATNTWSLNIDNGLLNGVIFIDLKKAFDTINHEILISKLSNYGLDMNSLGWFKSYLSDRAQRCTVNGNLSEPRVVSCGIPQGSNLGTLLFLTYINDLPNCLSTATSRMYADDTNISFEGTSVQEIEEQMNNELQNINVWLRANKLSLNVAKTEIMLIGSRQRLAAQASRNILIETENVAIKQVEKAESLGVIIDNTLGWDEHIAKMTKKISSCLGALKRTRKFVTKDCAIQMYNALITPHFDYCSEVWGETYAAHLDRLQKLQNRAARIVTQSGYYTSGKKLLKELGWDNLETRRYKSKAALMFKIMNNKTPSYLRRLFTRANKSYGLREAEGRLVIPKPRTEYLKKSLSYSGAKLWNSFPPQMRNVTTISNFKNQLENFILDD